MGVKEGRKTNATGDIFPSTHEGEMKMTRKERKRERNEGSEKVLRIYRTKKSRNKKM